MVLLIVLFPVIKSNQKLSKRQYEKKFNAIYRVVDGIKTEEHMKPIAAMCD